MKVVLHPNSNIAVNGLSRIKIVRVEGTAVTIDLVEDNAGVLVIESLPANSNRDTSNGHRPKERTATPTNRNGAKNPYGGGKPWKRRNGPNGKHTSNHS